MCVCVYEIWKINKLCTCYHSFIVSFCFKISLSFCVVIFILFSFLIIAHSNHSQIQGKRNIELAKLFFVFLMSRLMQLDQRLKQLHVIYYLLFECQCDLWASFFHLFLLFCANNFVSICFWENFCFVFHFGFERKVKLLPIDKFKWLGIKILITKALRVHRIPLCDSQLHIFFKYKSPLT